MSTIKAFLMNWFSTIFGDWNYLFGLAAVGFCMWNITGDPVMAINVMFIARWIKPPRINIGLHLSPK